MSQYIPLRLANAVRDRAGDICEYCLLPQELQEATFHVDHVVPLAQKGNTIIANLALACVTCSLRKGARIRVRDPKTKRTVRIFNPRKDPWDRHFRFTARWRIQGITTIGRATAAALGMNRRQMIAIRRELASMKRFPKERAKHDE